MFWAKAAVLASAAVVAGVVAAIVSFALGQSVLHGNGFVPANGYPLASLTDTATVRAVPGTAVYLASVALLSLGVGTLLRRNGGAIAIVLGLLFLPMIVSLMVSDPLRERLQVLFRMMSGLSVQATVAGEDTAPIGPWAGLAIAVAWSSAALFAATLVVRRRDV